MLCIICSLPVFALEPGQNYDFYTRNGQNLLTAELISEGTDHYVVKLKYVPKPITIHKSTLARDPEPSRIQPPKKKEPLFASNFVLHASGGFTHTTFGPLSGIFRNGIQGYAGADWHWMRKPWLRITAITAITGFGMYRQEPRSIRLISGYIGPKFLVYRFAAPDFAIFASPLAGAASTALTGYTFTADYLTFAATGLMSIEKKIGPVAVALQVYANYLFDSSLNFASTGIGLAVLYPLGAAQAY